MTTNEIRKESEVQADRNDHEISLIPYKTVDIKHTSSDVPPYITGLALMPNGGLILVDDMHCSLILMDSDLNIIDTLHCQRSTNLESTPYSGFKLKPYDVASLNDQEAIVTYPGSKLLQFVKTHPRLEAGRILPVDFDIWGVETTDNNIYVAGGGQQPCVLVLDFSGEKQRLIDIKGIDDQFDSTCPRYIAANSDGSKLYMSCSGGLLCITVDGQLVYSCSEPSLESALNFAIVVDNDENVYASCCRPDRILTINANNLTPKELLEHGDGLSFPRGIGYRKTDNLLFVAGFSKCLSVFKVVSDS